MPCAMHNCDLMGPMGLLRAYFGATPISHRCYFEFDSTSLRSNFDDTPTTCGPDLDATSNLRRVQFGRFTFQVHIDFIEVMSTLHACPLQSPFESASFFLRDHFGFTPASSASLRFRIGSFRCCFDVPPHVAWISLHVYIIVTSVSLRCHSK